MSTYFADSQYISLPAPPQSHPITNHIQKVEWGGRRGRQHRVLCKYPHKQRKGLIRSREKTSLTLSLKGTDVVVVECGSLAWRGTCAAMHILLFGVSGDLNSWDWLVCPLHSVKGIGASCEHCEHWTHACRIWKFSSNAVQCHWQPSFDGIGWVLTILSTVHWAGWAEPQQHGYGYHLCHTVQSQYAALDSRCCLVWCQHNNYLQLLVQSRNITWDRFHHISAFDPNHFTSQQFFLRAPNWSSCSCWEASWGCTW